MKSAGFGLRWLAAAVATLVCTQADASNEGTKVAFVGCPSGGQQDSQPAPPDGFAPGTVSVGAAERLAYYSDGSVGVLAPRGWHCASISGSGGGRFLVTPRREDAENWFRPYGQARPQFGIQLTYSNGGTSGRFLVADVIARIFPEFMDFARRVAEEENAPPLPNGPYADDRLRRVSTTEVEFTTPAGRDGFGTRRSSLATGDTPIHGLLILYPEWDMSLLQVSYRLAPEETDLLPEIVREIRRSGGRAEP